MQPGIPTEMRAAALDRHGGPEVLHEERLPVPEPKAGQVLVRLDTAGIGVWDPDVRSGELQLGGGAFPKVIGNDGAGEVVAVGKNVKRFQRGDRVYAFSYAGGFYAEYVAVDEKNVAKLPATLDPEQAGAFGADGVTAIRGLDGALGLAAGEKLLIFGASGGIGHLAVQLAKRIGAQVFAVASGPDGKELVRRLGADVAADGKHGPVRDAIEHFAPDGVDKALVLAHGKGLDVCLAHVRRGGRIAWPNGVEPVPEVRAGVTGTAYDGVPGQDAFDRLDELVSQAPFHVEVRTYALKDAAQAHRDVGKHHLGKLALRMN